MSRRAPWWKGRKDSLDYTVMHLGIRTDSKPSIKIPGLYALVPVDNGDPDIGDVLNVVGEKYVVMQPSEVFNWSTAFRKEVDGKLVSTWVLEDGKFIGSTVLLPDPHVLLPDEGDGLVLDAYVHLGSWFGDGGCEIRVDYVQNDALVFPHPVKIYEPRPLEHVIPTALSIDGAAGDFGRMANKLLGKTASLKTVSAVIEHIWPKPGPNAGQKSQTRWKTRKDEIVSTWQETDESYRTTAWGVLSAVNEWAQYGRTFRGSGGDTETNEHLRAEETLLGQTREIGQKAFAALSS